MQNSSFQQANMLAAQVREEMLSMKMDVLKVLGDFNKNAENIPPPDQQANSLQADGMMKTMKMLKSMQAEIKTLKNNRNPTNTPSFRCGGGGGAYQGNREYAKDKYCWSHMKNGSHTSGKCSRKREGHKPEATLTNRMGGSNRFCGDNK